MPKIKSLTVGKTYNTGNYTSLRLDITADLAPGESLLAARVALENKLNKLSQVPIAQYRRAKQIVEDPMNFTGYEINAAKELIEKFESEEL